MLAIVLTSSVDAMMRSVVDGRERDARYLDAREESRSTSEKETRPDVQLPGTDESKKWYKKSCDLQTSTSQI